MNCLTTRCTPVNFDIESPVAKLLGATTTTTASLPIVAEATLSLPTTPIVEALTPLVVATRPPTPHPSILDIEPYWPEPTTCTVPSLPPSLFQMEPFWEEEQPTFIHNPIMVTGWEEAPVNEEGPGSTWLQDVTNGNWMEPVWLNEFNEDQQEEEEVLIEPFIFNNIDFNNDSDDHWATRIRNHYPDDDAASIISVLSGRYQQRVNMEYPPSPPTLRTDGPLFDPVTIAESGSPTIRDEVRIRRINELFGLDLPLNPGAVDDGDNNSTERFSVVIDEDHVVTTYNDYNLFDNNNHSNYSPYLPIFTMMILNDDEAHSSNNKKVVIQ
ncbi:hypothetical protein HMPREF1544_04502 [Mucor circinelloides 1006PhL]|uniref:Uncharacterized protein n=1 Tax=Mucor circinelloides f. circinelloides (strain 1006PhL) TaxID=1220926 RepID=S2K8M4_MUCC1|nr:hypothetical protein HMPREF1544_04502 [Mucor circinelloides 1006PhL]